jgi:chemotaxis protein methyltransferase CheR
VTGPPPLPDVELEAAGAALARWAGLSLAAGLKGTLRQAVQLAAAERGLTPSALASAVADGDAAALALLAEHAVVGETSFWRHAEGLLALAARLAGHAGPLSLWSAGCASGEEPYSLALALREAGRDRPDDSILGTDLSERALARARAGLYGARSLRRLPAPLAARWFHPTDRGAAVDAGLARQVTLTRHNLLEGAPAGPYHAILCRNVLIYFEPTVAVDVLGRLAEALAPGGILLLGPVELPLAAGLSGPLAAGPSRPLAAGAGLRLVEEGGATLLIRPG